MGASIDLIKCYKLQSNYPEALKLYDTLIAKDKDNISLYYGKGEILMSMNKYEDSIKECDKALLISNDYVDAHYLKSCAYASLEKINDCLKSLTQAVKYGDGSGIKEQAKSDGYFERIRNNPEFLKIVK